MGLKYLIIINRVTIHNFIQKDQALYLCFAWQGMLQAGFLMVLEQEQIF
jgi:hypothetical protein